MRCAALLEAEGVRILIDAGPDIRQQLLRIPFEPLDGILLTHIHYDHVGGLDDIRGFCVFGDQHIYTDKKTCAGVKSNMPYCFTEKLYPGVPLLKLHEIKPHKPFLIKNVEVTPLEVMHGKLPILGFRIGKLAYLTDIKSLNEGEYKYLKGVETLVCGALRWEKEHHSHGLVSDAIALAERIGAKQTYLTHLTHKIGLHAESQAKLPDNVHLAYDELEIEI